MATLAAACSPTKPPTDDMGIATRNLAAARSAGADAFAPTELRFAEQKLAAANAAMANEDYDQATVLAAESSVNSELAVAKSRLGKARAAVGDLTRQNQQLKQDAGRHGEGAQP